MENETFNYPDEALEQIANLFKAFAQPVRLKIIRELHEGPKNVNQIHQTLGGSQANISTHLGVLEDQGVVEKNKKGVESIYKIASEDVNEICERVCDYFEKKFKQHNKLLD